MMLRRQLPLSRQSETSNLTQVFDHPSRAVPRRGPPRTLAQVSPLNSPMDLLISHSPNYPRVFRGFSPCESLVYEACLAILGRSFYGRLSLLPVTV